MSDATPAVPPVFADKLTITLSPWPSKPPQVFAFCALCITLVALAYLFLVHASDKARESVMQVVVAYTTQPEGGTTQREDYYILGFWTPDEETDKDLSTIFKESVPEKYQWQTKSNDERTREFELKMLTRFRDTLEGFRHHSTTGVGKSGDRKRGQWWSITISKAVRPETFIELYKEYWKPQSTIYIEVVGRPEHLSP